MSIASSESMTPLFIVGLIETAINHILAQHRQAAQTITPYAGKVIRIKLHNPHYSIYLVLCEEGVQILTRFDGVVDARVNVPASQFVWLLLGESADSQTLLAQLKITGNRQLIADLIQLAVDINLWHWITGLLQEWMPDYRQVIKQFSALRQHSSQWAENIQSFSRFSSDALSEIRQQSRSQAALLDELVKMRLWMEKKEGSHSLQLGLGLVLVVIVWFMMMK